MIIDSNFGNLCMKKGGSFQKKKVFIFFQLSMGGVDPRNPPCVRHCLQDPKKRTTPTQWRNQIHFTGGATRGQALFKGGGGGGNSLMTS